MRESLDTEAKALALYRELLKCTEGRSVMIEEYAHHNRHADLIRELVDGEVGC
jgi:bacterioferritin